MISKELLKKAVRDNEFRRQVRQLADVEIECLDLLTAIEAGGFKDDQDRQCVRVVAVRRIEEATFMDVQFTSYIVTIALSDGLRLGSLCLSTTPTATVWSLRGVDEKTAYARRNELEVVFPRLAGWRSRNALFWNGLAAMYEARK